MVLHRRAGKTVASLNHLQRDALRTPNSKWAYIAPTYKMAKNIAWDMIKEYSFMIPGIDYNESELTVKYPNGAKLTLYGADNPDSLRGIGLWGVVFDEYAQQPSNIFTEIISKTLADHLGYAIWIGTPKGRNDFYRVHRTAQQDEDYLSILKTIDDSIEQEEGTTIDNLQVALADDKKMIDIGLMTADELNQEWYCSFDAAIKGAFYAQDIQKMRNDKRITKVPHDKSLEVHTAWDLGMSDDTTIGFFQLVGQEIRLIDYYTSHGNGLDHYVKVLKEKDYLYGTHLLPHDIEVRELGTGKSRKEVLEGLGIKVTVVPNLHIQDGINAVRMILNRMWIDDGLTTFIDAIAQYRQEFDEKKGTFRTNPIHDWTSHTADMLRYFALGLSKLVTVRREVQQYRPKFIERKR